ncbi:MAG: hypothetical protein HQK87_11570 [Nitrospinae bacterium]|nr:hypothetical protein [Nitrospinota bacterium]
MEPRTADELAEGLFHYLRGYGRNRPENLEALITYGDWRRRAQEELERRVTEILQSQDVETLAAIAEGRIDVPTLASRVKQGG